jgi:hypothetical protein
LIWRGAYGASNEIYKANAYSSDAVFQQWTHVVATIDTTSAGTLYVNGAVATSSAVTTGTFAAMTPVIGAYGTAYWGGSIDDVRIYNRALSADEVKRLYNIGEGMHTAAPQQNKLTTGLVGYWPFNGTDINWATNTAYDRSSSGNNGTITGATVYPGKLGQALKFRGPGNSDYVDATSLSSYYTAPFSASLWIKFDKLPSATATVVRALAQNRNGDPWAIWYLEGLYQNDMLNFVVVDSGLTNHNLISDSAIQANTWYHVVMALDGSYNMRMYINGVQQGTTPNSGSITGTPLVFRIGGSLDSGNTFPGAIDDVRIYNRVLSADEIKELYNQAASTYNASQQNQLTTGLVGYWSFDGKDINWATNTAYDRSSSGNNGTITGATAYPGKLGQGLSFNGTSDYVSLPTSFLNQSVTALTVCGWIYLNTLGTGDTDDSAIFSKSSYDTVLWYNYNADLGTKRYTFNFGDASNPANRVDSITLATAGVWQHVCGVMNGTTRYIYLNGVLDNTNTGGISSASLLVAVARIGNWDFSTDFLANGRLDDVRVYNRALSAEEVKRLYNMGR